MRKLLAAAVSFAMCVSFLPPKVNVAAELISAAAISDEAAPAISSQASPEAYAAKTTTKTAAKTTVKTTAKTTSKTTGKSTSKTTAKTTVKTTTKKPVSTTVKSTAPKTTVTTTAKITTTAEAPYMLGDIDNDKKITGSDATWILREYTLISSGTDGELTKIQKNACDVDSDGRITGSDATLTLSYYTYQGSGGVLVFEDFMKYGPIDIGSVTTTAVTTQSTTTTTTTTSTSTEATTTTTTVTETSSTTTTVTDDPYKVKEIKLSHYEVTLDVGGGDMALVTMYPETALDKSEKWWSSDTSIATVNYEGWIIGIAPGECTVTVQSVDNPDVTAEIKVIVSDQAVYTTQTTTTTTTTTSTTTATTTTTSTSTEAATTTTTVTETSSTTTTDTDNPYKVKEIKLSHYEVTLDVGGGDMALVTMYPETALDKSEKWWSSDTSIATVNYEGWIVGIALGECTVTVQSVDNPDVTAEIKVIVSDQAVYTTQTTTTTTTTTSTTTATTTTTSTSTEAATTTITVTETSSTTTTDTDNPYKVKEIKLSHYEVTLDVGGGDMALVTMYPETALDKSEKWWSSNTSIATVNYEGWIVGIAPGECTVTVQSVDNPDVTAEIKVTVIDNKVTEIKLDKYEVVIPVGKGDMPLVTMLPESAPDKSERWWSSDESVATVNSEGWIVGIAPGECTVTVRSINNPDVTAEIKVTVTDEGLVKEIVLNKYEVELTVGKGDMPLVTMLPSDAEDKSEIWWSSDASIATVNYEGWIVGTGIGECTVTVQSAANPKIKAEIKVIVKAE